MPRILLADDDDSIRLLLRLMLSEYGHEVAEAAAGAAATASPVMVNEEA